MYLACHYGFWRGVLLFLELEVGAPVAEAGPGRGEDRLVLGVE